MDFIDPPLKQALDLAKPFINALVNAFVIPRLKALNDKLDRNNSFTIPAKEHFTEYYHRAFKKYAVVNTLVFKNSQVLLEDIYLPLTITATNDKYIKTKIESFPAELSDKYVNILITDTAGMGKSTIMKKIFLDLIYYPKGIPIMVELRRLNKTKKLIDEIQEQLNPIQKKFDTELLLELISTGGFIFILDGYDEISLDDRQIVTADIQEFISKASENKFFITSRPEGALASFGNFQDFKIEPLSKKEAFELLRKYDKQGEVSTSLINKLKDPSMSSMEEFLTNPLLVSLLFTAFQHKQTLPFKKYLFYRQVFDASFETHDLSKGDSFVRQKYSRLEIDDFHRVLRHIGFNCLKQKQIEFTKDGILELIALSKNFCEGLEFNESDFLKDLLKTVPLFTQDGNYYRWSHKSLQEYFASQFIYLDTKSRQEEILQYIYNHSDLMAFINILDLYFDMDPKTFRNVIERSIILEYFDYSKNHYVPEYSNIEKRLVIERKELTFLSVSYIEEFSEAVSIIDLDKITSMYPISFSSSAAVVIQTANQTIECTSLLDQKYYILLLLQSKNSSILKSKSKESVNIPNLLLNIDFSQTGSITIITENEYDEVNSKENFEIINSILKTLDKPIIDSNLASQRLKEIEESIEREHRDDFYIDGM